MWQPLNALATSTVRATFRALGLAPTSIASHLPRVGIATCALPDGKTLKLWSRGDDWIANQVFWFGFDSWESEMIDSFAKLAAEARTIVDVGAHIGFYSVLGSLLNPSAAVHAFEPHPLARERLLKNVALNGAENVTVHAVALDEREGTADFYVADVEGVPSASGFAIDFLKNAEVPMRPIPVQVTTFDRFAEQYRVFNVDVIKIDTETTEPSVLRGMQRTLRRDRPAIFCEVLPGFDTGPQIESLLSPLEYTFYRLTKSGPVQCDRIVAHADDRNWLFISHASAPQAS